MNNKEPIDITCCICSSNNLTYLNFGYYFNEQSLRAVKCRNCAAIFIYPQPSQEDIKSLYEKDYFKSSDLQIRPHGRADYFQSVESEKEKITYEKRLREISKIVDKGTLLDIGCGPGHFLRFVKQKGWDVTGIEISDFAASYARETFNLNVITGTIDSVKLPPNTFDVIFLGDLLEHVPNPKILLENLRELLSDKGIIYIEIPSVTNGLFSRLGNILFKTINRVKYINLPPYHLFEFTPNNCKMLFKISGYKIVSLKQGMVSPKDIGLRDSFITNIAKFLFQTINYAITKLTGQFGDRLTIIARSKI